MWNDPIIKELRKQADQIASQCDYDIHKYYEYLKQKEQTNKDNLVSFPPKNYSPVRKKAS